MHVSCRRVSSSGCTHPSPRSYHSCTLVKDPGSGDHHVLVYGGFHNEDIGDLFELQLDTMEWKLIVTQSSQSPAPRRDHGATLTENGRFLAIFGGLATYHKPFFYGDLCLFDIENREWLEVHPQGGCFQDLPCARAGHVLFAKPSNLTSPSQHDTICVYGGCSLGGKFLDDASSIEFDITKRSWSTSNHISSLAELSISPPPDSVSSLLSPAWRRLQSGHYPESRRGHSVCSWQPHVDSTISPSSFIVIFGGNGRKDFFNDTFIHDVSSGAWYEAISNRDVDAIRPLPRSAHAAFIRGSQMYIFGGTCGFRREINAQLPFDDLWVFDLLTGTWECIWTLRSLEQLTKSTSSSSESLLSNSGSESSATDSTVFIESDRPSARFGCQAVYSDQYDRAYLFFGSGIGGSFSDVWEFEIRE